MDTEVKYLMSAVNELRHFNEKITVDLKHKNSAIVICTGDHNLMGKLLRHYIIKDLNVISVGFKENFPLKNNLTIRIKTIDGCLPSEAFLLAKWKTLTKLKKCAEIKTTYLKHEMHEISKLI